MGALIWLASYPKSGNTWIRSFLHNLLRDTREPADINRLHEFCLGESFTPWYQRHLDIPLEQAEEKDIARIRTRAQADFTGVFPDSVFVKTHNYLGEWHGFPLHNMDVTAAAIYIVRNPLDVVISYAHHFDTDIDDAIARMGDDAAGTGLTEDHIPERHTSWSTHVRSWTAVPGDQLFVVRYEDLLARPRVQFRKLSSFLSLKPDKARLDRAIRHSSFKSLQAQERRTSFREKPKEADAFFRTGKRNQWRDVLSDDQVRRIIERHHEQMARFNYIPSDWND